MFFVIVQGPKPEVNSAVDVKKEDEKERPLKRQRSESAQPAVSNHLVESGRKYVQSVLPRTTL